QPVNRLGLCVRYPADRDGRDRPSLRMVLPVSWRARSRVLRRGRGEPEIGCVPGQDPCRNTESLAIRNAVAIEGVAPEVRGRRLLPGWNQDIYRVWPPKK